MAHDLGIHVIAEGVETEAQRELLAVAGSRLRARLPLFPPGASG